MAYPDDGESTELDLFGPGSPEDLARARVQQFHLTVVKGPDNGLEWSSTGDRCAVGSHPSNDLVLEDRTVSRFHCEVSLGAEGARVRDLDSRNGTVVDGVRATDAWLRDGSVLRLGQSELFFRLGTSSIALPLSDRAVFGTMLGKSVVMRHTFAVLEKAAPTDSTVLVEGETGTGKEEVALSLHEASGRVKGPFVVVDCSSIHGNLLESELFGHERGAFTGAVERRIGAFEAASKGTIFLDEVGELPMDLQPKLLRVLERKAIRRVGSTEQRSVDVRVIAATNRNLRTEVNEGRFRSDLYYRVAVVKVTVPALRERPDDIPMLIEHFLEMLSAPPDARARLTEPDFITQLQSAAWPGNVRQLRNYIEQCIVLDEPPPLARAAAPGREGDILVDPSLSYAEARRRVLDEFERRYLAGLLRRNGDNVSKAARVAGVNRVYLHRLLRRHGLRK